MTLALIGFLAAVNPAAAALAIAGNRRADRPTPIAAGAIIAATVLIGLAGVAEVVLDALDVNLGTYRLGAGVVMTVAGLRWLVAGTVPQADEPESDRGLAGFVAFPTLLTPGAVVLAVSVGAEHGTAATAVAVAVAVALGALAALLRRRFHTGLLRGVVRFLGAALTVVGTIVAVDGVRTL